MSFAYSAADSITGVIYAWSLASLDFSGAGYPGPNAPVNQRMVAPNTVGAQGATGPAGTAGVGPFRFVATGAPATLSDRSPNQTGGYSLVSVATQVVLKPFTATTFAWVCAGAPLTTDTVLCVVQKNGVDTAMTFTIPANTAINTVVSDFAHTVSFAQGDQISIHVRQSGATAQANWQAAWSVG